MQTESWLDQITAERRARLERKAVERAFRAARRRHGMDARNKAKLERLNVPPDDDG
ncbi:hypothetical protein [Cryptosporangium sp. NPDC051539]|uniref:hypothetical protein n=1 Tax=Cryptosporangium sp. NPDC051539 TaxID=3363962 RepID=UPI00379FF2CD